MIAPAKSQTEGPWIIAQRWSHVLFLSYPVDPEMVQSRLPHGLEVDTFDGKAWLSIVPFHMSHIRFPFTPAIGAVSLWELNLRTYVRHATGAGIYFFTLDTDSRLGQFIATRFFHLPYRVRQMEGEIGPGRYRFNAPASFSVSATIGPPVEQGDKERWLVERYALFTHKDDVIYRGDVLHSPWSLHQARLLHHRNRFSAEFEFPKSEHMHARYAKQLDVRFRPFRNVTSAASARRARIAV